MPLGWVKEVGQIYLTEVKIAVKITRKARE